ncbi:mediator of RNA polymerase II transcription subunit 18-like protein [Leptotrombidium deliense]|uniref:Mediator of RNA polymerase II transcription subunit 18 n=1 Tax=Leptotrombidium deliense TaxID=299467 RepID=A0A443SR65_9ACAR|nr:mediator of RNA polymerase II transcription subunit 18-like protein [Leptotrombidium deliense]
MNLLEATRRGGQQEYILQGSIIDSFCEILLHRLRGLCDNGDSAPETFFDHEYVYSIRQPNGQPMTLRVRQSREKKDYPWHLRYLGQPEIGDKNRATLVRSCIDVACSSNICIFLNEMGFKMDYEYICKGFMFKKGRMKVTVSKIFRLRHPGNVDDLEHVSQSYLVEVSVVAPTGQDALAEEIKLFAEQLKPLVQLEKVDPRRLAGLN